MFVCVLLKIALDFIVKMSGIYFYNGMIILNLKPFSLIKYQIRNQHFSFTTPKRTTSKETKTGENVRIFTPLPFFPLTSKRGFCAVIIQNM